MTCVCVYVKINFKKIFTSMCIEYTHTLNISKKKINLTKHTQILSKMFFKTFFSPHRCKFFECASSLGSNINA